MVFLVVGGVGGWVSGGCLIRCLDGAFECYLDCVWRVSGKCI